MDTHRRAPDLIITAADMLAGEALPTWASAFAVTDGIFSAVGDAQEVLALRGPRTEVRGLSGRTVLPGFIDSHIHTLDGGAEMLRCGLLGGTTIGEYQQAVRGLKPPSPRTATGTTGSTSRTSRSLPRRTCRASVGSGLSSTPSRCGLGSNHK